MRCEHNINPNVMGEFLPQGLPADEGRQRLDQVYNFNTGPHSDDVAPAAKKAAAALTLSAATALAVTHPAQAQETAEAVRSAAKVFSDFTSNVAPFTLIGAAIGAGYETYKDTLPAIRSPNNNLSGRQKAGIALYNVVEGSVRYGLRATAAGICYNSYQESLIDPNYENIATAATTGMYFFGTIVDSLKERGVFDPREVKARRKAQRKQAEFQAKIHDALGYIQNSGDIRLLRLLDNYSKQEERERRKIDEIQSNLQRNFRQLIDTSMAHYQQTHGEPMFDKPPFEQESD